jgi:hypothetical protein
LQVDPNAFRPDPHQGFAQYRKLSAVIELGGMPVVTRHDDVVSLMRDPRTRQAQTEVLEQRGITSGSLHAFYANTMLLSNPPKHAVRRVSVVHAFTVRLVEALRPRIRQLVAAMLAELADRREVDLLATVAGPLPARLIAEILGLRPDEASGFAAKVYTASRGLGAFRDADLGAIETAIAALWRDVATLLEDRRRTPRDDFLSAYLGRVAENGDLSPTEALVQIITVIIGGIETTRFGLTALLSLLLQHHEQWQAVCRDPSLAAGAVREALRFEPPIGSIGRVVTEDLSIGGVSLPAGTLLSLSILSAQRDESVFAAPQRFDIGREDHPRRSVSFGAGAHRCLGEALALAELEEALLAIATAWPSLELAGPPAVAKGHAGIRGITPLLARRR